MASYGGELLLDSSCPWSGISSLSSFSILLPFIFQEAKESIDEEDPRPTSSNGAYITETTVESTVFMVAKLDFVVEEEKKDILIFFLFCLGIWEGKMVIV